MYFSHFSISNLKAYRTYYKNLINQLIDGTSKTILGRFCTECEKELERRQITDR